MPTRAHDAADAPLAVRPSTATLAGVSEPVARRPLSVQQMLRLQRVAGNSAAAGAIALQRHAGYSAEQLAPRHDAADHLAVKDRDTHRTEERRRGSPFASTAAHILNGGAVPPVPRELIPHAGSPPPSVHTRTASARPVEARQPPAATLRPAVATGVPSRREVTEQVGAPSVPAPQGRPFPGSVHGGSAAPDAGRTPVPPPVARPMSATSPRLRNALAVSGAPRTVVRDETADSESAEVGPPRASSSTPGRATAAHAGASGAADLAGAAKDVASESKGVYEGFGKAEEAEDPSVAAATPTPVKGPEWLAAKLAPFQKLFLNAQGTIEVTKQRLVEIANNLGREFFVQVGLQVGGSFVSDVILPVLSPLVTAVKEAWSLRDFDELLRTCKTLGAQTVDDDQDAKLHRLLSSVAGKVRADRETIAAQAAARLSGVAAQAAAAVLGLPIPGLPGLMAAIAKLVATARFIDALSAGKTAKAELGTMSSVHAPFAEASLKRGLVNQAQMRSTLQSIVGNRVTYQAWSAETLRDPATAKGTLERLKLEVQQHLEATTLKEKLLQKIDGVLSTTWSEMSKDRKGLRDYEKSKRQSPFSEELATLMDDVRRNLQVAVRQAPMYHDLVVEDVD